MGRYDVLDGQAAKPATAMPNHYILDIPPDESGQRVIYLRRFYIDSTLDLPESSADAQRRASIASRASREAESLEQAWRTINSSGMDRDASAQVSEAGGPARDILSRGPCAIVCPQTPSNLAALWTFSSSPSEPPIPEGMREDAAGTQTLSPSGTMLCPVHGQPPSCLGRVQPPRLTGACRLQMSFADHHFKTTWRYFSYAIVERLAWAHGKRICMMPTSPRTSPEPLLRVSLAVRDTDSLLLTVLPRRQRSSPRSTISSANSAPRAVALDPLDLPAVRLGPFSPDSAQLVNLESAFRNALGPGWRDGRQKQRYHTVLDGDQWSDWSVLWVPVEYGATKPASPTEGSAPTRGPGQRPQGVLTIWPTHLISSIGPRSGVQMGSVRSSTKRKAEASTIFTAPEPEDLLKTAAGLFDFLSTYKEPDPPGEAEADGDGEASEGVGPSNAESGTADGLTPRTVTREEVVTSGQAPGPTAGDDNGDGGSDLDDLFSERGGSPRRASVQDESARPTEDLDVDLFSSAMPDGQAEQEDLDDLFGGAEHDSREAIERQGDTAAHAAPPVPVELDKDEEMASPSPPRYQEPPSRAESGFQFENNFVTEDDFAFFDSPGDDADATPKPAAVEPIQEDQVAETATVEVIPEETETQQAMSPQEVIAVPLAESGQEHHAAIDAEKAENAQPSDEKGPLSVREASPVATIEEQAVLDDPDPPRATEEPTRLMTPESPLQEHKVLPEAVPLPPSPSPPREIIPGPFEPLDLPSASGSSSKASTSLPSLAYRFPTPALTPEELRVDLIERLRPADAKKARYDYASAWHTADDDASDLDQVLDEYDETEDGYTAPPTPDSQIDGEWYSVSGARPSPAVLADGGQAGGTSSAGRRDASQDGQLEWNDSPCVAAEWLWLRCTSAAADDMACPFDPSWLDGKVDAGSLVSGLQNTAEVAVKRDLSVLEQLDLDRFAKEIVSDRQFRQILSGDTEAGAQGDQNLVALLPPSGTTLQDLAQEEALDASTPASWQLEPCNVHAGYDGRIMSLGMAGLRFWPQLGLSPLGGRKNIDVTVICGEEPAAQRAARQLAARFTASYEALRLGSCGEPSITAVQPQNVGSAVQALSYPPDIEDSRSVVFILFNQSSAIATSSALEICFAPRKIPATTVFHVLATASMQDRHMSAIAFDVYNRLCKRIERVDFYGAPVEPDSDLWMDFPSFTLAAGPSDPPPKLNFELNWPIRSYDLLNKWRMVHGAYAWDSTTGVVVAFAIDAEGENWRVGTWRFDPTAPSGSKGSGAVSKLKDVWDFFVRVAKLSAIEWRLSICKLGMLQLDEFKVWQNLLAAHPTNGLTLLTMDPPSSGDHYVPRPRPAIAALSPAVLFDPQTRLIDETLLGRACSFAYRFRVDVAPFVSPPDDKQETELIPRASFLLNVATPGQSSGDFSSSIYHVMASQAAPGKEDEDLLQLLEKQYYRLLCLGRLRFGFDAGDLPVHLEAVRAVLAGVAEICPDGNA